MAPGPRGRARSPRPPPPAVLSVGGREGICQRINGDYELAPGVEVGGRPCWARRGLSRAAAAFDDAEEGYLPGVAGEVDSGPLYLFFGDMGYWTIAPSPHAAGVQVLARSGPDFGVLTPDAATSPWVIFAHGKGKPDPAVVCFRHDDSHEPPDAVHLTGCRGAYGVLNGLYQRVDGVSASTRPIFAKDGMSVGSSSEDERQLLHFSQRVGRWLLTNLVPEVMAGRLTPSSSSTMVVLAKSPVTWKSMSPVHLMPRDPWLVL